MKVTTIGHFPIGASLALALSANAATNSTITHLNRFSPREAWNQTFIDDERARCPDPRAAQRCCPGYCLLDYTHDKKPAKTCCPVNYHLSFFGNAKVGHHDMQCCDNSVSDCQLGSNTKSPKKPFDDPSTNVGFVQQQCMGKSGAAGLSLGWKVLLPAVGFSTLCMVNVAL